MEKIRAALEAYKGNRSQKELAEELGLDYSTVSRLIGKNRSRHLGVSVMRRLAKCPAFRDIIAEYFGFTDSGKQAQAPVFSSPNFTYWSLSEVNQPDNVATSQEKETLKVP